MDSDRLPAVPAPAPDQVSAAVPLVPPASSSPAPDVPQLVSLVRPDAPGWVRAAGSGEDVAVLAMLWGLALGAFLSFSFSLPAVPTVVTGFLAAFGLLALLTGLAARHSLPVLPAERDAVQEAGVALGRVSRLASSRTLSEVVPSGLVADLTAHRNRALDLLAELAALRDRLEEGTGHASEVGVVASASQPALAALLALIDSTRTAALSELSYLSQCRTQVEELYLRWSDAPGGVPAIPAEVSGDLLEHLRLLNRAAADVSPLE